MPKENTSPENVNDTIEDVKINSGQEIEYINYDRVIKDQSNRAKEYHNKTIRLEFYEKIFDFVVLLLLVLFLVPNYFRDISPFGQSYSILTVAFVALLFLLVDFMISLPLSFYGETIEREFEFATRSTKTWIVDKLKELAISMVIMLVLIEALFSALHYQPKIWWVYAFLGYFVFAGILQSLSPFLISIFTKIEPLPEGNVRSTVEDLASRMDLDYEEIYKWNMSEQTTKVNAAVTGFGKTIRIILGDTLIEKFRPDEIEVVMAHEIAHQKNKDVYRGILFSGLISLVAFWLIDLGFGNAISWFNLSGKDDPAAIGYFVLALTLVMEILGKLNLWYTRTREKAADLAAIKELGDLTIFESAFARLSKENLSFPNPSRLEVVLRYSHPPIRDRIQYGKEYVEKIKES